MTNALMTRLRIDDADAAAFEESVITFAASLTEDERAVLACILSGARDPWARVLDEPPALTEENLLIVKNLERVGVEGE